MISSKHRLAPNLIITDLKMPHMGGLELLQWLHAHETWARMPRVVLTSSTATSDVAAAYAFVAAAAYLVKPMDIHELRAMAKAMSDSWRRAESRLPRACQTLARASLFDRIGSRPRLMSLLRQFYADCSSAS